MTPTEPTPTDILAQKRAEATATQAAPSLAVAFWLDRLNTPEGRAAVFAELMNGDLIGEAPTAPATDRDLWLWIGNRMRSARLIQDAIQLAPIQVGAMWAEAMAREFERQGKKQ